MRRKVREMIGKIHRIQAYATWTLYAALLLLIVLPGRFRPGLYRNDLILVLIVAGLLRFLLPIGTVLSIIAKGKEDVSADAVRRIQFFTFLLSIPMPLVLLVLWLAYTGV